MESCEHTTHLTFVPELPWRPEQKIRPLQTGNELRSGAPQLTNVRGTWQWAWTYLFPRSQIQGESQDSTRAGAGSGLLEQSECGLEKNFQTQSISEGSEFIKKKEQR